MSTNDFDPRDEPVQVPIDGVLDLHTFHPADLKNLLIDYLEACRLDGIIEVRIIHGKGTGALRRQVHALLAKHPDVIAFQAAPPEAGGWGATLAILTPRA